MPKCKLAYRRTQKRVQTCARAHTHQRKLWAWHTAGASRRLVGAAKGTPAEQRDLPRELRNKYEAVKVLEKAQH